MRTCAHCRQATDAVPVVIELVGLRVLCAPCRASLEAMGYGVLDDRRRIAAGVRVDRRRT